MFSKIALRNSRRLLQDNFSRGVSTTYLQRPGEYKPNIVAVVPGEGSGPAMIDVVMTIFQKLDIPVSFDRFDNFVQDKDGLEKL